MDLVQEWLYVCIKHPRIPWVVPWGLSIVQGLSKGLYTEVLSTWVGVGTIHGGRTHGVLDRGLCTWGWGQIHEAELSVGFYGIFHQPNE